MSPTEIAEAVTDLFEKPFDAAEFPYEFLRAFGSNDNAIKRLRKGDRKASDVMGGVLLTGQIHLATCERGGVERTLGALRSSPATLKGKLKFILATDGDELQAESLRGKPPLACDYREFPGHFGPFLALANITTVEQIDENPIDIQATGRLNKLVLELLKTNPEWAEDASRERLNHFLARLIFCFFAEDNDIFPEEGLFTRTVVDLGSEDGAGVHAVMADLFRAMAVDKPFRRDRGIPDWTAKFPYVNGDLFSGETTVPRFSRSAKNYLRRAGGLDWGAINPDIFGSMIQRVADKGERGSLGMHYTSVPNILKVLNPLFLDDLRASLERAGDNARSLLNLRKRLSKIRVFDPACGSGNFLVIAYREIREIEATIDSRRGETGRATGLPLSNFRGIEIDGFACEIARLSLVIASFQSDVRHRGILEARNALLPLKGGNWITRGNALRVDWTAVFNPESESPPQPASHLFEDPLRQQTIDFENEPGETYLCGNPPYKGQSEQTEEQKADLAFLYDGSGVAWKSLDYVSGWLYKFSNYQKSFSASAAFVCTNSICQGQQVPALWPKLYKDGVEISFAYTSFKWKNLASHNAGVTVIIVGLRTGQSASAFLYSDVIGGEPAKRAVSFIGPYLVPETKVIIKPSRLPLNGLPAMDYGSKPADGGGLIIKPADYFHLHDPVAREFIKLYLGSDEYIDGKVRYCLWVPAECIERARTSSFVRDREARVREFRLLSKKPQTKELARLPYDFAEKRHPAGVTTSPLIIPIHTGEDRRYLPVGALVGGAVVSNAAFALYDAPLWNLAIIASRLHLVWIATVCGKLKTDFRYSNTLGWNTFPMPTLTTEDKADLTRCAEDILLARERHFPATIAELYDPERMPQDLRDAHERNDDTLERIFIGGRFRNDTERLERLFEMYTALVAKADKGQGAGKRVKAESA